MIARERIGAWPYALTGGYSKPQMYPAAMYGLMTAVDKALGIVPALLALRTLVVLRNRDQ